jgi:regulatory protein YycI of two-component signal transduction system YycFG
MSRSLKVLFIAFIVVDIILGVLFVYFSKKNSTQTFPALSNESAQSKEVTLNADITGYNIQLTNEQLLAEQLNKINLWAPNSVYTAAAVRATTARNLTIYLTDKPLTSTLDQIVTEETLPSNQQVKIHMGSQMFGSTAEVYIQIDPALIKQAIDNKKAATKLSWYIFLVIFKLVHPEIGSIGSQTQKTQDQFGSFTGALKTLPDNTIITITQ